MTLEQFAQICDSIPPNENGCVLWPEPRAQVYVTKNDLTDNRTMAVGRLSLSRHLGRPLLPGMFALHRCDTPHCVAQAHLFEGTHQDNMQDMVNKCRAGKGLALNWTQRKIAP